jgi:acetyl-CoA synthetase
VQARIRISKQLSPIAVPSEFVLVDKIPKNRSGKIMRRVLKAQYTGQNVGDISTMED